MKIQAPAIYGHCQRSCRTPFRSGRSFFCMMRKKQKTDAQTMREASVYSGGSCRNSSQKAGSTPQMA